MSTPFNPHCIIRLDNREYSAWREQALISRVTIDLTTEKSSEATLVVFDPKFEFTDRHLDAGGLRYLTAQIWLGFGALDTRGVADFKGRFVEHDHDGTMATFRFHDEGTRLKQGKKTRYHTRASDLQIMRKVADEHGLSLVIVGEVEDSEPHASLIQRGVTDYKFLRRIAERAGLRFWFEGDTMYVQGAGKTDKINPLQTLTFRKDFTILTPLNLGYKQPENRRGRPSAHESRGRGRGGRRLSGTSEQSERGTEQIGVGEDLPHHTTKAAKRRAKAKKALKRENSFEHRIRLIATAAVSAMKLRGTINLSGVGKFYTGAYLVHEIHREFTPGNLTTELSLRGDIKGR